MACDPYSVLRRGRAVPSYTFNAKGERLDKNGKPMCDCWKWNESHIGTTQMGCLKCCPAPKLRRGMAKRKASDPR